MLRSLREGIRQFPRLVRQPRIALRWILGAHVAQAFLVGWVLLLILALPKFLDPALDELYPPIRTQRKIIGPIYVPSTKLDPRREVRRDQIVAGVWGGGAALAALLFVAAIPRAVARSAQTAERSAPADRMTAQEISQVATRRPVADAGGTLVEAVQPTSDELSSRAPQRELPGSRYRIERELGRGGMGVVFLAQDTSLDRRVALKELPHSIASNRELVRRFRQEARLLARLSHPNIVQVFDLVEEAGRLWIVMELVEGGTLSDAIGRRGRIPWPEAVRLVKPIATALGYAHDQGLVHRDVKPINVLLTPDGVPKLTDFGLAKLLDGSVHTQEGLLLGSVRYMSPEQVEGKPADARSDIYALGVTCFELLCGRAPFEGETPSILAQHLSKDPPCPSELVPELPVWLDALVLRMLAKDPKKRPVHMSEVLADLS